MELMEQLDINGTKQWILCSGNEEGSILLFVHGGPGSPLMMFSSAFDQELIKRNLVIHWDQRGSGKSYSPNLEITELNVKDFVKDGIEIVKAVKKRFQNKKLILIGHSWGTIVASQMIKNDSSLFDAYVSIGTVVDYEKADTLKHSFLLKNNEDKNLPSPPFLTFSSVMAISRLMHKYNKIFNNLKLEDVGSGIESSQHYDEKDFQNQSIGAMQSFEALISYLKNYKAMDEVSEILIPTYFVQGSFDLATPSELVKDYFKNVSAPRGKEYIEFKKSAHFPMYEEPVLFAELISQIDAK